jgi:hypothetical protein
MHMGAMTFDEFLTKKKITNAEAAIRLGRDQTIIGRYRARSVTPSPEIIAEIVDWSRGKVSPRELLKEAAE